MKNGEQYFQSPVYYYCVVIYVTFLVTAFATASKLAALPFGLSASVSTITCYAFCFIVTDVVSELFGYKASRQMVKFGLFGLCLALLIFQVAVYIPVAEGGSTQDAFAQVLGYPHRIIVGGLLGYFLSQQTDIFIYHLLKKKTNGKHLWLRNNASTFCAQLVDSVVWISIAFGGVAPNLLALITGEYIVKLCVAGLDTIVLYAIVMAVRGRLRARHQRGEMVAE